MAIDYTTLNDMRTRLGYAASATADNNMISAAITAASRAIDKACARTFEADTSATARVFWPQSSTFAMVDDFHTTVDLIIATDEGNDGTYETTWGANDYELLPLNGVVDGEEGWPFYTIRATNSRGFPCDPYQRRAPLRVTAKWGWAAVPDDIEEATKIAAAEIFKLKDAPFGIAGGFGDFGPMRIRENPYVARLINPYRRNPVMVG